MQGMCNAKPNREKQRGIETSTPNGTTERICVASVRMQKARAQRLYIGQSHFARSSRNLTQRN